MARRLIAVVSRALTASPTPDQPHFHQGAHGQPAVCFDARCASPRLDI
jgi:hypothetical protein